MQHKAIKVANKDYSETTTMDVNTADDDLSDDTRIQNLREKSFHISGPQLFNILPQNIRNMTKCSIDDFKLALDKFLSKIPDEPNISGQHYTPRACNQNTGKPSNSVIDQDKTMNTSTGGNLLGG